MSSLSEGLAVKDEEKMLENGMLILLLILQMSNWTFSRTSIIVCGILPGTAFDARFAGCRVRYSNGEMRSSGERTASGVATPQKKT